MNAESRNEKGSAAVNPNGSTIPAPIQTSSGIVSSGASQQQSQNTNSAALAAATPNSIWAFTAQDIVTYIFQLVALAIALIFGAWAIKSYDAAETANNLSLVQNQLALLAFCQSSSLGPDDAVICGGINAALALDNLASSLSISLPLPSTAATTSSTAVPTPTPQSSTSSSGVSSILPSSTTTSELSSAPATTSILPSSSAAESTTVLPGFSSSSSTSTPSATASVSSSLPTVTSPASGATPPSGTTDSAGVGLELGSLIGIIVGVVAFVGAIVGLWRIRRARRLSKLNSAA